MEGSMEAIILAGGKGTRLKPYTTTLPKPLVPVGEHPIVSIVISRLRASGVTKITMAVNHLAELIMSFFGSGQRFGVQINYAVEEMPLGTVGPIKQISDLPDHFIVMNGDILTDIDYAMLWEDHLRSRAMLTIAAYRREVFVDFGVLKVDASSARLLEFEEKPTLQFDVSMGVYVFSRAVLECVPPQRPYGFDNLVRDLLEAKCPINIHPHRGYWLDLGRPDDYDRANRDIELFLAKAGAV
jgi:NDP-sugar pyrophosphorylase family protein